MLTSLQIAYVDNCVLDASCAASIYILLVSKHLFCLYLLTKLLIILNLGFSTVMMVIDCLLQIKGITSIILQSDTTPSSAATGDFIIGELLSEF